MQPPFHESQGVSTPSEVAHLPGVRDSMTDRRLRIAPSSAVGSGHCQLIESGAGCVGGLQWGVSVPAGVCKVGFMSGRDFPKGGSRPDGAQRDYGCGVSVSWCQVGHDIALPHPPLVSQCQT